VIWVEGPSDRIYINHWIAAVDSDLVEGIHYSIMFYGGRLLSHLSANDNEVTEFIGLRSLNQNLAVIIDSDKRSEDDTINETKKRIVSEFGSGPGMAWVTKGREIENYIDQSLLHDAVKTVHSNQYDGLAHDGMYSHALYFKRIDSDAVERSADKVKIAKAVCAHAADLGVLDLRARIEELVAMIHNANL
jgi:hypothetical protein